MYSQESYGHAADVEKESIHTVDQALSCLDCEGPPPPSKTRVQSAPATVNWEVCSDTLTRDYVQRLIAKEKSREYENPSYQALQDTVEHARLDLSIPGSAEVKQGLKTSSDRVFETVFTDMA